MTETESKLKKCFEDVIWMAIRYANGRHTYAPYVVRDAVNAYKQLYPEWNVEVDHVVINEYQRFKDHPEAQNFPDSDWLADLFTPREQPNEV